jgi:hypothetical protein
MLPDRRERSDLRRDAPLLAEAIGAERHVAAAAGEGGPVSAWRGSILDEATPSAVREMRGAAADVERRGLEREEAYCLIFMLTPAAANVNFNPWVVETRRISTPF